MAATGPPTGLYAEASHNVWLHDLNIHGLAASGIQAGGLADWTVERVKINKNGRVGWNFNIGTGSSNSGKIILRDIEIAWNGCGERVATGEPWACWAQKTGGYGDGLGTTDTGGQFLVEDAFVHHNTSDGLDFRYMDGAPTTSVTLRRVYSVANAGNQVKVKGNSLIENSVLVSQCGYFKGRYFMLADDSCRASGNTLQLVFTQKQHRRGPPQHHHRRRRRADRRDRRRHHQQGVDPGQRPRRLSRLPGSQQAKRGVLRQQDRRRGQLIRATWSGRSRAIPAPPAASAARTQAHQHDPRRLRCRAPRRQPGDRRGGGSLRQPRVSPQAPIRGRHPGILQIIHSRSSRVRSERATSPFVR
jgi:hypothetical protein